MTVAQAFGQILAAVTGHPEAASFVRIAPSTQVMLCSQSTHMGFILSFPNGHVHSL